MQEGLKEEARQHLNEFLCSLLVTAVVYEDLAKLIESEHFDRYATVQYCKSQASEYRANAKIYSDMAEGTREFYNKEFLSGETQNYLRLKAMKEPLIAYTDAELNKLLSSPRMDKGQLFWMVIVFVLGMAMMYFLIN